MKHTINNETLRLPTSKPAQNSTQKANNRRVVAIINDKSLTLTERLNALSEAAEKEMK